MIEKYYYDELLLKIKEVYDIMVNTAKLTYKCFVLFINKYQTKLDYYGSAYALEPQPFSLQF